MAVIVRNPDSIESVRCAFDSLPVDYRIISETDPESEGIRACLENHKLILVDSEVRMSHGKPLYTGLATVFENLKGIPVFLMAPGTLNVNKDSLQSQGLSGLIRKPLFPRDILAVLDEFARNPLPGFSPEQKVLSDIPEGQSLKILLAEDNPINTKLAVGLIQLRNWKVDCAVNGAEAVDKFRIRTYDLVLMDIQMPELDGLEATKKIREIEVFRGSNPTPVIAVSAHALKGDIEKALNSGMDDYIIKPFKPNELYSMIEKYTCKRTENEPI
jgi:CheY-like chemotaxis protein